MNYDLKDVQVAILAANGFEESELLEPKSALEKAHAQITVISPDGKDIQGMKHADKGQTVQAHASVKDVSANHYDALLIPGGLLNPDTLRTNDHALQFVKDFFTQGKPVASICHGPQVLISADLVQGRTLTAVKSIHKDLQNAGAKVLDEEVVVDQGLVTSRTPEDLPAFCDKMLEEFAEGYHRGQVKKADKSLNEAA